MRKSLAFIGWFLSPTRKIIDWLKSGDRAHRGKALRYWSFGLFCFELFLCILLILLPAFATTSVPIFICIVPLIYAYSRINEITYAFYRDALSPSKDSDLEVTDRIRMAMRSYYGLAFNFALLYYFFPIPNLFKPSFNSFFDAFYFSGITLATLGYGDIVPIHGLSRFLALCEVFTGILIVAVAIATYVGGVNKKEQTFEQKSQ